MIHNILELRETAHPSLIWSLVWIVIFLVLLWVYRTFPKSSFSLLLEYCYERVYEFFSETLSSWWDVWSSNSSHNSWIVQYVTVLFFVILIYNLAALVFDPIASITWADLTSWTFNLAERVTIATWDIHFNAAMAIVSIGIMLYAQASAMKSTRSWPVWVLEKVWRTIYEYVPIFGKNLVSIDQWSMPRFVYIFLRWAVKVFDIIISLFIGLLDIIWLWAKILSLAARLFGNMIAWSTLASLLIIWGGSLLAFLIWWLVPYDQASFPFLVPIIIYAQGLLVALIQAFVFPLLVAIFIKVAQWENESSQESSLSDKALDIIERWVEWVTSWKVQVT